jgi:hypothetical protein
MLDRNEDTIMNDMPLTPETRTALQQLLEADSRSPEDPVALIRALGAATSRLSADETLQAVMTAEKVMAAAGVSKQATWQKIGESLGITAAAARDRYSGKAQDLDGRKAEIARRREQTRKRARLAVRSIKPTSLPGLSAREYADTVGLSRMQVYRLLDAGTLQGETVTLDDGRSYRRVLTSPPAAE